MVDFGFWILDFGHYRQPAILNSELKSKCDIGLPSPKFGRGSKKLCFLFRLSFSQSWEMKANHLKQSQWIGDCQSPIANPIDGQIFLKMLSNPYRSKI
jgi:hypothetical protein